MRVNILLSEFHLDEIFDIIGYYRFIYYFSNCFEFLNTSSGNECVNSLIYCSYGSCIVVKVIKSTFNRIIL